MKSAVTARLRCAWYDTSSKKSSWSHVIGEMFGGQHRVDEVTRTEPVGWTGKKQPENCGAALAREGTGAAQLWECVRKE